MDQLLSMLTEERGARTPFINPAFNDFPADMPANIQRGIRAMSYKDFAQELGKSGAYELHANYLHKLLIARGVIVELGVVDVEGYDTPKILTRQAGNYTVLYTAFPAYIVKMTILTTRKHNGGNVPDYPDYVEYMRAQVAEKTRAFPNTGGFDSDDFKDETVHCKLAPMWCSMMDMIENGEPAADDSPPIGGILGMLMEAMMSGEDGEDDSGTPPDMTPVDDLGNRLVETDD